MNSGEEKLLEITGGEEGENFGMEEEVLFPQDVPELHTGTMVTEGEGGDFSQGSSQAVSQDMS